MVPMVFEPLKFDCISDVWELYPVSNRYTTVCPPDNPQALASGFISCKGTQTIVDLAQYEIQSNLSYGVTQGMDKKWLLKTGDPLIQVHLH